MLCYFTNKIAEHHCKRFSIYFLSFDGARFRGFHAKRSLAVLFWIYNMVGLALAFSANRICIFRKMLLLLIFSSMSGMPFLLYTYDVAVRVKFPNDYRLLVLIK